MIKVFATNYNDTVAVIFVDYFVCDFRLTKCNKTLVTYLNLN
jgi:hypothetical protein